VSADAALLVIYLLCFPSYDVINDVIMSDADCTPGREPRSVATSFFFFSSPNLSGCRLNVYHTSSHGVALVQIWNAGLKCAARGRWKYRT